MLPDNIEQQILRYLHLEYGEEPEDPKSLQLSDLVYAGEHLLEGRNRHCWTFPSMKDDMWATVELSDNGSYCIGMEQIPTPEDDDHYTHLTLLIEGKKDKKFKIPYSEDSEYEISCFDEHFSIELESGKTLTLYSEIFLSTEPYGFSLSIEYDDRETYLLGAVGLELRHSLDADTEIHIDIGNLEQA